MDDRLRTVLEGIQTATGRRVTWKGLARHCGQSVADLRLYLYRTGTMALARNKIRQRNRELDLARQHRAYRRPGAVHDRQAGRCRDCGEPSGTRLHCPDCLQMRRARAILRNRLLVSNCVPSRPRRPNDDNRGTMGVDVEP